MNRVFPAPDQPDGPKRRRKRKPAANGAPAAEPPRPALPPPPPITAADKVRTQRLRWLWPHWVPLEALTVLEGRKGDGKSCLLAALAAHVTGGRKLPGAPPIAPGAVLWFAGEEHVSAETQPKLAAAGADLGRVFFPGVDEHGNVASALSLPRDLKQLEAWVGQTGARLVVLDPLPSFFAPGLSLNAEQDVRGVLEPLRALMGRTGCAAVLGRHVRKSHHGDARDQGMGSGAIGNVARSVLRVSREKPGKPRILLSVVSSNLGKRPRSLAYELADADGMPRVSWQGESELTADELAQEPEDVGRLYAYEEAKRVLLGELTGGPKPAKDVLRTLQEYGVLNGSANRAKAELGIVSTLVYEGPAHYWVWSLPPTPAAPS